MSDLLATNHRIIKFFGIKIIDIWDDYYEKKPESDDLIIREINIKNIESDN